MLVAREQTEGGETVRQRGQKQRVLGVAAGRGRKAWRKRKLAAHVLSVVLCVVDGR